MALSAWPSDHGVMNLSPFAPHPSAARTVLGFILLVQAICSIVFAALGVLFASTYLFETDHDGMFDGIQVPIGLFMCGTGIVIATVLLVTRSRLRRDGMLPAVCAVEFTALFFLADAIHNPIFDVLRASVFAALDCIAIDLLGRKRTAHPGEHD